MANVVHVGAQTNHQAAAAKVSGKVPKGGKGGPKGGKGGGGRRGGGGGGGFDPLQLQAQMQVQQAELPIEQQIKAEKASNLAAANNQMGFAKAAAAIMQNAAPAVGQAYTNAANADAGYSRGLGDQVQSQINQNQQADNSFLQQMGTPQGALNQAAPVGDMSYGLQGYIPATTLQREGAGWESAAQLAPGNVLHAGQQLAQQTLANDPALAKLQDELGKVAATEPALYDKLVGLQQGQQRLGIENFRALTSARQGNARLAQGQQRINLTAARDQVLASQGQQRIGLEGARLNFEIRKAAQSNKQAWARIGIEGARLRMEAAKNQAKLNGGGYTPDEISSLKKRAYGIAYVLKNGNPKANFKPVTDYKTAFKDLVDQGIPPTIANQELKDQGYKVPAQWSTLQKSLAALAFNNGAVGQKGANEIVQLAHQFVGTPYVWGGESPRGFDCSGFAQYLYGKAGINIPRTTYTQWTAKNGFAVSKQNLRPGDLVFFRGSDSKGGLPGHVGVYIGNGMMIDAPYTGSDVRVESVWNFGGYMGARRYR